MRVRKLLLVLAVITALCVRESTAEQEAVEKLLDGPLRDVFAGSEEARQLTIRTSQRELEQSKARGWLDENNLPVSRVRPGNGQLVTPTCYVVEGTDWCAPHYIVAGAMKSGTTSLFSYLLSHPYVEGLVRNAKLAGKSVLANKEVRFFNEPTYSQMKSNYGAKSLEMYLNVFPHLEPSSGQITGEASPMYICQAGVAGNIKGALPEVKVIIMLRNPVERCWSEYWFLKSLSPAKRSMTPSGGDQKAFRSCFEADVDALQYCKVEGTLKQGTFAAYEAMEKCLTRTRNNVFCKDPMLATRPMCDRSIRALCPPSGIKNSIYILQLYEWVNTFDKDHLMIILSEDFYADTPSVMDRVVNFLGIPSEGFDWSFTSEKAFNIMGSSGRGLGIGGGSAEEQGTSKYPPLDESTKKAMEDFFDPYNKALFDFLGVKRKW